MDRFALIMFSALTGLIVAISTYALVSHNLWSTAVLFWFVIQTAVWWGLRRIALRRPNFAGLRWLWLAVSIVGALTFVATLRPPLTSLVVTVRDIPATSQFTLKTVRLNDNEREIIKEASRLHPAVNSRHKRARAKFILINPVKEEIQRLELRFGNHPYSWTLESIEVGTDFARIPIPVAKWTGAEIANTRFLKPLMTGVEPDPSTGYSKLTTLRMETTRASRAAIRLNLSRAIVVRQAADSSYEMIRAGWFFLFLIALGLAVWVPNCLLIVKRIASKVPAGLLLRYLNSTTRPTSE